MVMRKLVVFALCLLAVSGYEQEGDVLVLTDATIEDALKEFNEILIEFYAPWCGHCQKLAPEYAKAATLLKQQDPPIPIAKVDATANPDSAGKYGVQGYPTLKWFIKGSPKDYEGPREAAGIVEWINKKLAPSTQVIDSLPALDDFIAKHRVTVVLFAQRGSDEAVLFESVSKGFDEAIFVLSTSTDALISHQVTEPSMVVFKRFDDRKAQYSGNLREKRMTEFVKANMVPWAMPFDERAVDYIFKQKNAVIFIFRSEGSKEIDAIMREAAATTKDFARFCYADLSQDDSKKLIDHLGVHPSEQPTAMAVWPSSNGIFKFKYTEEAITVDALKVYAEKFRKGKLEPYYKSQEIPREMYEEGVRVLVGKNFESVVMDETKDVMVEFYAPWCGHCKKLQPEYEDVAYFFRKNPNIIIAKIDATANETPGQSISGYPTLRFFPSTNKQGILFEGERNQDAIIEFIQKEATAGKPKTEL